MAKISLLEICTGGSWSPGVTTIEVFFSASEASLGAPVGGGGRFLEEMGGINENDMVNCVDMIFRGILNTTAPRWAPNCFCQKMNKLESTKLYERLSCLE